MKVSLTCLLAILACFLRSADIPLSGSWTVSLPDGTKTPVTLPGTLEAQGIGAIAQGPRNNPPNAGTLSPRRQFVGIARYSRTFTIPEGTQGDHELLLERVMWKNSVSIDGITLGTCDSLAAPHLYTVPARLLTPGTHTLTVEVDNRQIINIGEDGHCYGDTMQFRWHGILGTLALRPANPLRHARIFAPYGDQVTIELPNKLKAEGSVEGMSCETLASEPGRLRLRVQGAKPWSDTSPQLYTLTLRSGVWTHKIRFGFRTIERRGNRLFLNGAPLFLRGNLDCCNFPLTGYPPTDKTEWGRIFARLKQQGVNQVRFHSWCPPAAAFEAADEMGVFLSPEVLWIDWWMTKKDPRVVGVGKGDAKTDAWVEAELSRILSAYGNNPSFISLGIGNELGTSDFGVMGRMMAQCKARDPRRLYAASTARTITPADDIAVTHYYPGLGMVRERRRDGTDWDYEDVYAKTAIPTVAHEVGQWPVWPQYAKDLPKYVGTLRPWNLEVLRDKAAKADVLRFNDRFVRASLMLNQLLYKDEIESFQRTPSCSGVSLLGAQDYYAQGEALIGWLDAFYDPKVGAEDAVPVSVYLSETPCLARFAKDIWTTDETFVARLQVRNNAAVPLSRTLPWSFAGMQGEVQVSAQPGEIVTVKELRIPLQGIKAPARLDLTFGNNRWPLWVYPSEKTIPVPKGVTFAETPAEARKALQRGERVVFSAAGYGTPATAFATTFRPVYWSAAFFPGQRTATLGMWAAKDHPAFTAFPTEDWGNWQWKRLLGGATAFRLEAFGRDYEPIVLSVPDFHHPCFAGLLFEARVGEGRLLVSGFDLSADLPEARQLCRSLLTYAASSAFDPKTTLPTKAFDALFADPQANAKPRPKAFADAVAYVECSPYLTTQGRALARKARFDRLELGEKGTCQVSGSEWGAWADATGTFWFGRELRITFKDLSPVRGRIKVRFRDPNRNHRTGEGTFEGRPFKVPLHEDAKDGAWWLDLPVDMEDFLDGELSLTCRALTGPNLMIDRIVVLPNESDR